VDGMPLDELINGRPLPIDLAVQLAIQIADALEVAHAKRIIHRDIKPANILVTGRKHVKVLDFGIAKQDRAAREPFHQSIAPTVAADSRWTGGGKTVGTAGYMSPEQARGEEIDARADIFAFGALLFEMTTGRKAFEGSTPAVMFAALLGGAPVSAARLNPALP